jgi:hypothetical protein
MAVSYALYGIGLMLSDSTGWRGRPTNLALLASVCCASLRDAEPRRRD